MRKYILIVTLAFITLSIHAQRSYYYKTKYEKALTYQASLDVIDYDGLKYGWSLGGNYKEIVSLTYFHVRDYEQTETSFMDSRYGGVHLSVVAPIWECLQVGGGARWAYLINGAEKEGRRMVYSFEARMDLGPSTKLAFEYGLSDRSNSTTGLRLIWNLY